MAANQFKVALLGDINIDVFLNVPDYPPPGGDALVYDVVIRTGGSVTNTAIILARLGIQSILFSRTGDDAWADNALQVLQAEGIDISGVGRDPKAGTGLIFIPVTPDGERTMFSYRGANALLTAEELTEQSIAGVDLLHLSGYSLLKSPQKEAAWKSIDLVKSRQGQVTLDLGVEPATALGSELGPLLSQLDLIVLGLKEAEVLSNGMGIDQALDYLLAGGVKMIGLKLGKEGCLLATPAERVRLPGFKVQVVDTTGAGDAFSAGLIYGKIRGMSLGGSAMLGNALGALSATVWGGGVSLPSIMNIRAFMQDQERQGKPSDAWLEEAITSLPHTNSEVT